MLTAFRDGYGRCARYEQTPTEAVRKIRHCHGRTYPMAARWLSTKVPLSSRKLSNTIYSLVLSAHAA
jgi:hypothetical protein